MTAAGKVDSLRLSPVEFFLDYFFVDHTDSAFSAQSSIIKWKESLIVQLMGEITVVSSIK